LRFAKEAESITFYAGSHIFREKPKVFQILADNYYRVEVRKWLSE